MAFKVFLKLPQPALPEIFIQCLRGPLFPNQARHLKVVATSPVVFFSCFYLGGGGIAPHLLGLRGYSQLCAGVCFQQCLGDHEV